MKSFFGKIIYGLLIVFLLLITGLFGASLLPIPGNYEVKIVKSGSMEPAIKTGGIVIVKPSDTYVVGDVIMFGKDTAREIPTTHRIAEAREEALGRVFVTKGDANEEVDPQVVPESSVIGKVVFSAPYAGFVFDFARQPLGFVLLVGVPAAAIILDELWKIFDEVRNIRRRKKGTKSKGKNLES